MKRLATASLIWFLSAFAALGASTVNPNVPPANSPLTSAPVRSNFLAAYTDINNILGVFAGVNPPAAPTNLQSWADTSASPNYVFKYWNAQTTAWVPYGTLNVNTGTFSPYGSATSFLGTAPIAVSVTGGVVTYSLNKNGNFATVANNLAFASIASGNLLANCGASSAEPTACSWSSFADRVVGGTNGLLPYRTGGSWGSVSTGTTGHALPFLDALNTWSVAQNVYPGAGTLPAALTGALVRITNLDGTTSIFETDSYGASGGFTCARTSGTIAAKLTLSADDQICSLAAHGYDGTAFSTTSAAVRMFASQTWTGAAHGSYVRIGTTANGTTTLTDRVGIENDGGVTVPPTVTGGSKGAGTINASNLYWNGSVVGTAALQNIGTSGSNVPLLNTINSWGAQQSIAGLIVTGSFTATGLVGNTALVNSSTTVNGQVCVLGGTCTISASAGTITVGTTLIASGTSNGIIYNNAGVLGNLATANNSVLSTNGSGVPALSTTLPSGLTATSLTLITPALGTPASGIMTSVTGLPLTTGVTGTLPIANGGTGGTTASGTLLDNITAFSGTGFLTRTGAGTYAFQSTTNGITRANLAQVAANSFSGNSTASLANESAFTIGSLTNKATPVSGDLTAIQDSVTGQLRNVTVGALASAGSVASVGGATGAIGLAGLEITGSTTLTNRYVENLIINGDFRINQRGYLNSTTLAAGAYGHDRWKAGAGGGDYSFTQLASSTNIAIASGKSLIQVVEDKNVVGGTYTLSWSGTCQARYGVNTATPSGAYAASPVVISGQTAGTTMSVEFGNVASCLLGSVKLETGSVATPFVMTNISSEILRAKRYFLKMGGDVTADLIVSGIWSAGGAAANGVFTYPTEMRISPVATVVGTWTTTNSTLLGTFAGKQSVGFQIQSVAAGNFLYYTTNSTTYLTLNAELYILKIGIYNDSTGVGVSVYAGVTSVSPWPPAKVLQAMLDKQYGAGVHAVNNYSQGGMSLQTAITTSVYPGGNILQDIVAKNDDLVILGLLINDAYIAGLTDWTFASWVSQVKAAAEGAGKKFLYQSPPPITDAAHDAIISNFFVRAKLVSPTMNVADIRGQIMGYYPQWSAHTSDGVHPNQIEYLWIGRLMYDMIVPLL